MSNRISHKSKLRDRLLTVKDLVSETGVDAQVVRFYARTGLIRATRQAANGYRLFVPLDVKRVRFVRSAQSLGFTLAEIREIFIRCRQNTTPCPLVRDIIMKRLRENREHLNRVRALQKCMESASKRWRHMPDGVPNGETICALIEAVAGDAPAPKGTSTTSSTHLRRRVS